MHTRRVRIIGKLPKGVAKFQKSNIVEIRVQIRNCNAAGIGRIMVFILNVYNIRKYLCMG